ncbi:hypothetical protein DR104_03595, partial [Mycoplasma hyorhinis]
MKQVYIDTIDVQLDKKNNKEKFLKITNVVNWAGQNRKSDVAKRKIVCYHFLGGAINHYFIQETKEEEEGVYNSWNFKNDNTKDGTLWLGNYLIKTEDNQVYIGTGKYIERIKSHIKEKEWGKKIKEIFIWTLDQKGSILYDKWFEFVEQKLIEKCQPKLNKIDGKKTHLEENIQKDLKKFIEKTEEIFKAFNLSPFEVSKLTPLSQDKKNEEKRTQNNEISSLPFKKPENTYTEIKGWVFEFFKLNQGITLTKPPIEIFIKKFKNNDDNTIIVKKGSYIRPTSDLTHNYKELQRAREEVFKKTKILEKYEINSEKSQELQEDVEIINCSVNKILMAFLSYFVSN